MEETFRKIEKKGEKVGKAGSGAEKNMRYSSTALSLFSHTTSRTCLPLQPRGTLPNSSLTGAAL